jgi:hypothetical protein
MKHLALVSILLATAAGLSPAVTNDWQQIAQGVEYRKLSLGPAPLGGTGELHVVRINPDGAKLQLLTAREHGSTNRTAREWSRDFHLSVVINAGMYNEDHSTHTGYLRARNSQNNPGWVKDYQSILLLEPRTKGAPNALLLDREDVKSEQLNAYDCIVQNLRLMKFNGVGVWSKQERRWSEAALASDAKGNLLFLFVRAPYSMYELIECLRATDLGIVRAAHLEGGPEASLTIHTRTKTLHLAGSHETGFNENEGNDIQWPLPNVIGVLTEPTP